MLDDRMVALEAEYAAAESELADPATLSDPDRRRAPRRRHKELGEIVRTWQELAGTREDVATAREMLTESSGDERELMRKELEDSETRVHELEERLQTLLLPKDPNEGRNVIMEIRGSVGGDEANLFARNLYDMYLRYAAMQKWKVEVLSEDSSDKDGINEAVIVVKGPDAYLRLEHEGGPHPGPRGPVAEGEGPHPHLHRHRHRLARGPRGRDRHRSQRPQGRRLPFDRSGGTVGQHDRLGRAHHAHPDGHRRGDAGREEPDPEPRQGDGGPAGAPAQGRTGPPGGRDVGAAARPGRIGQPHRQDPHLQLQGEPRHRPPHQPDALQARPGARRRPGRGHRRAHGRQAGAPARGRIGGGRRVTAQAAPTAVVSRGALVEELTAQLGGARHEARFIADEVLPAGAPSPRRRTVPVPAAAAARSMAARRAVGEPLQYVFGHWPLRRRALGVH